MHIDCRVFCVFCFAISEFAISNNITLDFWSKSIKCYFFKRLEIVSQRGSLYVVQVIRKSWSFLLPPETLKLKR
jgi:hypothetical protein